jgi:hypothetical protein
LKALEWEEVLVERLVAAWVLERAEAWVAVRAQVWEWELEAE